MAGAGNISVAEIGLRVAEQNAPQANTFHEMIYTAANQAIAEGNAAKAAETVKNPAKTISEEKGKKRIEQILKKDSLDQQGVPAKTQDQQDRQIILEKLNKTIVKCREVGFSHLNGPQQQLLRTTLVEALFDHPTIREVAKIKIPNIDVTSQAFRQYCIDTAENLLSNQQIGEKMANGLVDILEVANIDYTDLLKNLDDKKDLDKTVLVLTTEIGNDGTNNQPKDGLHKDIEDQENTVKRYKTKIVTINGVQTVQPEMGAGADVEAQWKVDAEIRLKNQDKTINLYKNTIKDVDNYFAKHSAINEYDITDPENPAGPKLRIDRGDWANKKTEWDNTAKDLETNKLRDQKLIEKIDQQEKDEAAKLKQFEEKLKTKKAELDKNEKTLTDLVKKIDKTRDVNEKDSIANKEREIIESLERMIVQESLDIWALGMETAGKIMPEVMQEIGVKMTNKAKEFLREDVWDDGKKRFRKDRLNAQLDSLITNGVDKYGLNNLQVLFMRCNQANAPPELKKFLPVIKEMVDFSQNPPLIINQEKVTAYGSEIIGDMLKMVAYKDPKALENKFSKDERAMASLKGDILPALLETAMKDSSLKSEVEKSLGMKATRGGFKEFFKNAKWGEIIKWLLIALGVIGAGTLAISLLPK
ncbi:hypothetical protein CANDROIZ_280002 [Candidatus Roizmanbacteria bacterium]|nr:hypothetical protein CANDROIZ_280002 [Candidatus Roizmanbacteria bacterium]